MLALCCAASFFGQNAANASPLKSQKLYWIGGSGNFNDPAHWSFTAGAGISAQRIPDTNTDIEIKNMDPERELKIVFANITEVNSLSVFAYGKIRFVNASISARLIIHQSFDNDRRSHRNLSLEVSLEFSNSLAIGEGYINTGELSLSSDLAINSGRWRINTIILGKERSLFISHARIDFSFSQIEVGGLTFNDCDSLKFNFSSIKAQEAVKSNNSGLYTVKRSTLVSNITGKSLSKGAQTNGIAGKFGNASTMAVSCIGSPTYIPASCVPGGCDGQVVINIPPYNCYTPAPTAYTLVLAGDPTCQATYVQIPNVSPGPYTITNICPCMTSYGVGLLNDSQNFFDGGGGGPIVQAQMWGAAQFRPNTDCFGTGCNGTANLLFGSYAPPINYTIATSLGAPTLTVSGLPIYIDYSNGNGGIAAVLTETNTRFFSNQACASSITINAQDAFGCTYTLTGSVTQPNTITATFSLQTPN